ncbi:hypothetical protein Taro_056533 [Colocasia esculenta]|uniref:FHA domain-containing protein n=1 Tax=Colocasia esculenta TaxID=4460 RepID=A0A843XTR5_COLES|nr:hypothetical protein [Colocasia esculenta]
MAAAAPAAAAPALSSPFPRRIRLPPLPLLPGAPIGPLSPSISSPICFRSSVCAGQSVNHLTGWKARRRWGARRPAAFAVRASAAEGASETSERWLLEPVGDGDCRHIGYRVRMPSAFELASNVVTVGRLPEKADMVIPVATVSGVHARLEKKDGALLVTDLDSTNGTFIDEKKLRPGAAATVAPGSCITFGDTHLAIFRVSKLQIVELASGPSADSEVETVAEVTLAQTETAS